MDTADIVLISDPQVLAIPIEDNGDTMTDLKTFPDIRIDERKEGPFDSFSSFRTSVAYKLLQVQGTLPDGYHLLVIEGYRPLIVQKKYFDDYSAELKRLYPNWSAEKIYQEAGKYVAPPDIIPPHSTGGAVDLTICDEHGNELDMGTSINTNPEESKNTCFTAAQNISDQAKKNRRILIDAMTRQGFVNYPTEWWHWSYGDRYWAYVSHQDHALFNSIS